MLAAGMSSLAGAEKVCCRLRVSRVDTDPDPLPGELQVPMSRFEPDEYVNDRYAAIEERLAVCGVALVPCFPIFRLSTCSCAVGCAETAQQAPDTG